MAANVESMFYIREKPWYGFGIMATEALIQSRRCALQGWNVTQKDTMMVGASTAITGFKANVRNMDESVLGIVPGRYRVAQNAEAFQTDETKNKSNNGF